MLRYTFTAYLIYLFIYFSCSCIFVLSERSYSAFYPFLFQSASVHWTRFCMRCVTGSLPINLLDAECFLACGLIVRRRLSLEAPVGIIQHAAFSTNSTPLEISLLFLKRDSSHEITTTSCSPDALNSGDIHFI